MAGFEKPKGCLLDRVMPHAWFIKFQRSLSRKSPRSLKHPQADSSGAVNLADSVPFLPKVVENIYKTRENPFNRLKAPPNCSPAVDELDGVRDSAKPEISLYKAFGRSRSFILSDAANETASRVASTHGRRASFSVCSPSALCSLGHLCSAAEDEKLHDNETSQQEVPSPKTSTPATLRSCLLSGCGSFSSRNHGAHHETMELEHTTGLIELDVNTGRECAEGHKPEEKASWRHKKFESWSKDSPRAWSLDLIDGEVVKCLVNDVLPAKHPKPPTLKELFSNDSESDDAPMIPMQSDREFEDPNPALPWNSSKSSFGSSGELGGRNADKRPWSVSESDTTLLPHSGDSINRGNVSDSQSLLKAKVLSAQSFRKQRQVEKQRQEETKKLLASLDRALDEYNLKRLLEEEDTKLNSPKFELHNSPVFESFLESSAKAWGVDFPPLRSGDESRTPESVRELHCITVQSPIPTGKEQKPVLERGGKEITRDHPRSTSQSPGRVRKSKRSVEKEPLKKRSPSRNCEDRIHHPQEEESTINFVRLQIDEVSHRRRRRTKQRRLKPITSGVDNSMSPHLPLPGSVVKESVAVVVESSYDPYKDFRESMIEMIVDQNIHQTSDLEELLQCYLALNEPEYHNVIVDVFTDVWHDLFEKNSNLI